MEGDTYMKRIMIIGCGAMGSAILSGCLKKGLWKKEEVSVLEHTPEKSAEKAKAFGVSAASGYADAGRADLVLLAVKPNVVPSVLREIAGSSFHGLLVSIAAAVPLSVLEGAMPEGTPVVRVMPNTPVSVGEGMAAIAPGKAASKEMAEETAAIFASLGRAAIVTERQLDELGALSGAGPGYAFVIIDALSDAGVRIGLPRAIAIEAAAQTLYGAAKMVLETGIHPAQLRDQVTSPGGTTIAGIHAMEKDGIRAALIDGVVACLEKSDEMGKKS